MNLRLPFKIALLFFSNQLFSQCQPSCSNGGATGDYIANFTFNGISNVSNDTIHDFGLYLNFDVNPGGVYPFLVQTGSPTLMQGVGIWIDFNEDFDFADPGEFVYSSSILVNNSSPLNGTITIPAGLAYGIKRLRVACKRGAIVTSTESCSISGFGEYEDYFLRVGSGSPCNSSLGGISTCLQSYTIGNSEYKVITIKNHDFSNNNNYTVKRSTSCAGVWYPVSVSMPAVVPNPIGAFYYYGVTTTCNLTGTIDTSSTCSPCLQVPLNTASINPFKQSFAIYPNPVKDFINVNDIMIDDCLGYSIVDLTGKLVSKNQSNFSSKVINVSSLIQGSYLLQLHMKNGEQRFAHFMKY